MPVLVIRDSVHTLDGTPSTHWMGDSFAVHQYRTHRVISAYSVIVNLMNLSILEKRIIGVHILRGFPLMENWIEGCGRWSYDSPCDSCR